MPQKYRSPLNTGELHTLAALARKANHAIREDGVAPFYVAADGGDMTHPDAYIFMAWPFDHRPAANMARWIFEQTQIGAAEFLGATMDNADQPVEEE
jgi:hypothetical protein